MPESDFKEVKSIDDISCAYYGLYVSRKNIGDLIDGKILCAKLDYFGNEAVVLRIIDAVPVKHGNWVIEDGHVCCSECGEISKEYNYCPFCGANMRGEE